MNPTAARLLDETHPRPVVVSDPAMPLDGPATPLGGSATRLDGNAYPRGVPV